MRGFARSLLVLGLLGCGGPEGPVDADGDGVPARKDCNDADPAVFPGAPELCNRVDDDCDGIRDEDAVDAPPWYLEADHDGHGNPEAPVYACEQPGRRVDNDQDCNDADPNEHPGAWDYPGDGIDRDCDGEDATEARCWAQARAEGDVWITSAVEAEAFCTEHNGVTGTLHIEGSDLIDLSALDCLCEVGSPEIHDNLLLEEADFGHLPETVTVRRLEVRGTPLLGHMDRGSTGVPGLAVADDLVFEDNPALFSTSCIGLDHEDGPLVLGGDLRQVRSGAMLPCGVDRIDGDLYLQAPQGTGWDDWVWLEEIGGTLSLRDLPAEPLVAFDELESVGGDLVIEDAPRLQNPFGTLAAVHGSLRASGTQKLQLYLAALSSVGGDLEFVGNHVEGLLMHDEPVDVGGDVIFVANQRMREPGYAGTGLGNRVASVGDDLELSGNIDLCVVPALAAVPGNLRIVNNSWENCILTLPTEVIGGSLEVVGNRLGVLQAPALASAQEVVLSGNAELTNVELPALDGPATLEVSYNPALVTLDLASLTWAGDVFVDSETLADLTGLGALGEADTLTVQSLASLGGLESLHTVGSLVIRSAPLTDLGPLSGLHTVTDLLELDRLDQLRELDGLQRIDTTNELSISRNDRLVSLRGLEGMTSIGSGGLTVEYNPQLPGQLVQAWVDALPGGVVGAVVIQGNAP